MFAAFSSKESAQEVLLAPIGMKTSQMKIWKECRKAMAALRTKFVKGTTA